MASHNVYTFFSVHNCLDEEFDVADAAADHDLCRAIVAGKAGLHPEAWDTRSGLTAVMPQGFHGYEWVPERYRRPIARSAAAIAEQERENTEWEARHRRRPVEEPKRERKRPGPKPKPYWHWVAPADQYPPDLPAHGEVQLTCDDCRARYRITMHYRGNRPAVVQSIRLLGKAEGWTCIAGTDRCPGCSGIAPPQDIGNGAGAGQGHE